MLASEEVPDAASDKQKAPQKKPSSEEKVSLTTSVDEEIRQRRLKLFESSNNSNNVEEVPVVAPVVVAKKNISPEASLEHLFCLDVFHVVVDVNQQKHFPSYHYLPLLGAELAKTDHGSLLSVKFARSILLEVRTMMEPAAFLQYLLECFVRVNDKKSTKAEYVTSVQSIIINQSAYVVQEGLAQSQGANDFMLALIQSPPESCVFLLGDFVRSISNYLRERPETLQAVFGGSFSGARYHMSRLSLTDNFEGPFSVLQTLLQRNDVLSGLLLQQKEWELLGTENGAHMERQSWLGPFFRVAAINNQNVTLQLFSGNTDEKMVEGLTEGRKRLHLLHRQLEGLVRQLLRNPVTQRSTLEWFRMVIESNKAKTKMQYDESVLATDGFLLNCLAVVARLFLQELESLGGEEVAAKFLNPVHWLKYLRLSNWESSTPLCGSREGVADFRKSFGLAVGIGDRPSHGLLNDLFFLCLGLLHVASGGAIKLYRRISEASSRLKQEVAQIEGMRPQWEVGPGRALMAQRLQNCQADLVNLTRLRFGLECQMFDQEGCTTLFSVMNCLCRMLSAAAGDDSVEPVSLDFAAVPEFLVYNMVEYIPYAVASGCVKSSSTVRPVVEFFVRMMGHETRISNRHLRGQVAEALCAFPLVVFEGSAVVERKLASSCVSVWVAVEETGRHGQYYEKLFTRQHVMNLFRRLCRVPWWDKSLLQMWNNDRHTFVRFVHMLLNDTELILDDAFVRLGKIAKLELEMEDQVAWGNRSVEERHRAEQELLEHVRLAKGLCDFSSSCAEMMTFLVDLTPEPLLIDPLGDRAAAMLNYFLRQLLGPKYVELNVRNPDRFRFKPRELLQQLLGVYLKLGQDARFVDCLAKDLRSFHYDEFRHGVEVLERANIGSGEDRALFKSLVESVNAAQKKVRDEEKDIEIPDEFICPLLGHLMSDPVKLPCGEVVDRVSIMKHMLDKATDPYTRQPLTVEMLVPDEELANKIRLWKESNAKRE